MATEDRRANPRYPAWFPINIRVEASEERRPGMLCDLSAGGALVWGFWSEPGVRTVTLEVTTTSGAFELPAEIMSVERQWDTVILHLQFAPGYFEASAGLAKLLDGLRGHFDSYQVYLAHRADDDPAWGRTITQYPTDRASA